jgi:hypothetical protein
LAIPDTSRPMPKTSPAMKAESRDLFILLPS